MISAELLPTTFRAGVASNVVIALHNTGTGSCTNIVFQVRLPHELVLEHGLERFEISRIGPGQRHELAIRLLPRQAGQWTITIPNFSFTDPSGRSCRVRDHGWSIEVLPEQPSVVSREDSPLEQPRPAERHREKIFLSYHRRESKYAAGWLYDRLHARLRTAAVFWDVRSIKPGEDFMKRLNAELATCTSLLAIIGPQWLEISRQRLINADDDLVRHEITVALERNILIIPVLVDGATMPTYHELPEGLGAFAHRNAISVEPSRFGTDVTEIVMALRRGAA